MQFTANVKDPSEFSPQKRWSNGAAIGATALAALGTLAATDPVADALDELSKAVHAERTVTTNSIGKATSVLY